MLFGAFVSLAPKSCVWPFEAGVRVCLCVCVCVNVRVCVCVCVWVCV